jgi:hypothetical protein
MTSIFENEEANLQEWDDNRKKNITGINNKIDKLYEMLLSIESEEIKQLYQQKLNELILEKKKLEVQIKNNKKLDIDLK